MKRVTNKVSQHRIRRELRNKAIVSDFFTGMSFLEIGKKYGINREYCRQIIVKNTKIKYKTYKKQLTKKKRRGKKNTSLINLILLCKKLNRVALYKEAVKYNISWDMYKQLKPKLIELGFKTTNESKKEILINDLKELAIGLNKVPSAKDINILSDHWASDYQYYFRTLKNAQQFI